MGQERGAVKLPAGPEVPEVPEVLSPQQLYISDSIKPAKRAVQHGWETGFMAARDQESFAFKGLATGKRPMFIQ